ncbi:tail fiber domain-containing protein [Limosilactobacillus fermentum]|uniref:tail fiber domain-containing protein n=1 Tax=Limosilactobacillus fermentum TaxID=1613 RepID=UPI00128AEBED|nr:tail fiber domain-containing protein [Limosilactobacillus fermentum]MCD5423904.1 hypothetical protein [Limosilactobacillus fermentum]MPW02892.1 hypothetical protein [Limosilactobacillus fermentum]
MVQTLNFINLSSQQAPNDVNWAGLVNSGVQGVLIRLGHGIIRDPCASGHIAKAKQYGLYWHGYHTYEGVVNEPQFTIKNATELGLSTSQYYFVDLTKSSDPFNDYYALHANWLSQGYSTGLLISNEDYLSKFTDSEVTASGTLRWLISDAEPADYDVWQYSSEGTVGTSSVKVGFNFAKTDKLKYNLSTTLTGADISKDPYNPQAPVGGAYIGWGYDTTGLGGGKTFGYSTNGKNFYALVGPKGLVVRKSDGNRIYGTIADQIDSAISANVIPAKSAADSAYSMASQAVEQANVTKIAQAATAEAVTEAKQGANDAMSRAVSAWDVATGAKEAVTDFDPLLKQAQSDAGKALTQIADTAIALSDAKTAFSSDVAVAKNLANTAQTTADNAVKSASSVADDLTAVANQAKANANGITKVTSDVGLLQTTVADNSGNISTIKETAKQIQQAVSDNAGNITVAKQTADSAVAVASDAKSNATVAIQTASQASITASNASGQAASAVFTANGAMTTASDAKSDATVAVQTASGASLTAINANSDATVANQTASEAKIQASNAESDFAQLSIRAGKIEANVANNSGAIASVQQTANGLTAMVASLNARDGINLLQGTSATDNEGPSDFSGIAVTAGDNYTFSGWWAATGSGIVSPYIQYYDSNGNKLKEFYANQSSPLMGTPFALTGTAPANAATARVLLAKSIASIIFTYNSLKFEHGSQATPWTPAPTDARVAYNSLKVTVDQTSNIINDPKTGLNATYQTATGNATTISNVKSDVYQLQTTANGLTSRVGNLESKTNTQETAIEQNKNAIALKADQTAVDKINGTVSQLQSSLTVQAGQIQEKVTSSQVTGMLAGYATQDYTQSLVTQKANDWNLNLTNLKTDVNAIKTAGGGVNLLADTRDFKQFGYLSKVAVTNGQDKFQAVTGTNPNATDYDIVCFSNLPLEKDTDYTASFWVKTSENVDIISYLFDSGSNGNYADGATINHATTEYKRFVVHFHNGNNNSTPSFIPVRILKQGVTVWLYGCMLEEGTVAHTWSPAPSDMATVTSVTNLSATVDGIKGTVATKADQSTVTQLSNVIQSKVSSDDFNNLSKSLALQTLDSADINTMKTNGHYFVHNLANTPIQGWVYVDVMGNGNDRIRQDVYQDSYYQHCYRRWYGNSWTDWYKSATESEITQLSDDINLRVKSADLISQINLQAGTALIQSNKLVLDAGTTVFTGDAFIPSAAISSISADKIMLGSTSLYNSDGTMNLVNTNDGTTSKISVSQGSVNFDGVNKNASIIKFASDNNTNAFTVNPTGATVTPTLFFERFDQTVGHWLGFTRNEVENEGVTFHTWDDDGQRFFVSCHARFDKNLSTLGTFSQGTWDGTTAKPEAGVLTIKGGNTIWSGSDFLAVGSNVTGTYTGVWAKSFSQQSTLSSKTNIETVDSKDALDLVNKTDIRSYQYKSDVAQGKAKRYTSLIIDDVNDVSKYYAPDEFINEERTGRDDGSAVGYLFLAVQELTKRIKTLEGKLNG